MKKLLAIVIFAFLILGIRWLLSDDCAWCGDAMIGDSYRITNTDEVICERCYKLNPHKFEK